MALRDLINNLKFPKLNAIYISLIALIISFIQLFFSIPLFSNYYLKPELYLYGGGSDITQDLLIGHFAVFNAGNLKAQNVEVGLLIPANYQVILMPKINSRIIREEIEPDSFIELENIRIEIDSLLPRELISVAIYPDEAKSIKTINDFIVVALRRARIKKIPSTVFIRSAEGTGKVIDSDN